MTKIKTFAALAAVATVALAATDLSAAAQSSLTNGPNGAQPNTLSSDVPGSANGTSPSRARLRRHATMPRRTSYAERRPLTVRRAVLAEPAPLPTPVVVGVGPGSIVTGPLAFGSNLVSLPFRALNAIFPSTGDIATNPLVLIGAPIHAIGDIAQAPFRIAGAPFGGTTITSY